MNEEWRLILGGAYEISASGDVKRLRRARGARVGAILRPVTDPNGYVRVCVCTDRVPQSFWVHRLVAEAFIGDCPRGMQVNHRDGNKTNNHRSNLEYVTPSENQQHAMRMGLRKPENGSRPGELNGSSKLTANQVLRMRALRAEEGIGLNELALRFGVSKATAWRVVTGKGWRQAC